MKLLPPLLVCVCALWPEAATLAAQSSEDTARNAIEAGRLPNGARPEGSVDPGQPTGTLIRPNGGGAYTPAPNSPERAALMDTLRPVVAKDLEQKVIFVVDLLRVQGNWAFLRGKPRRPTGGRIDYRKTKYREAVKEGAFDDNVHALFQKTGGVWKVVTWGIGATDVPYGGYWKQYGAPKAIFDYTEQ